MENFNIVSTALVFLSWVVILIIAVKIYDKQAIKPNVFKAIVALVVSIFSLSLNFEMFGGIVKLPILPLGVWIMYWFYRQKKEKWQIYRSYAWLGFIANFIFLITTLVVNPIHDFVFSKNDPTTFISNVNNAVIYNVHPSAKERMLNIDKLLEELQSMEQSKIYSEEWYHDLYMSSDANPKNERFPYQLVGSKSKSGSGIDTLIYVEEDGKGLLITTVEKQYYFRSKDSFLERSDYVE